MGLFAEYDENNEQNRLDRRNNLKIRPATEHDLDAIAEIAAEREGNAVERVRMAMERSYFNDLASDQSRLLVASSARMILGYGKAAYFTPSEFAPSNTAPEGWYLTGMVVRPQDRRCGIGRALTQERMVWLSQITSKAYYFSNAQNRVSIALHRNLGFREMTRDFWFPDLTFEGGVGILFSCDFTR